MTSGLQKAVEKIQSEYAFCILRLYILRSMYYNGNGVYVYSGLYNIEVEVVYCNSYETRALLSAQSIRIVYSQYTYPYNGNGGFIRY